MIQNSKMKHNKGFGLYLMQSADVFVENTEISDNLSGGIKSVSSAPLISDFIVRNNKGTGILVNGNVYNNLKPVFQRGTIMNNTSINNGGGVSVGMDAYITMTEVSVISNTALKGGGIYCQMGGIELVNSNVSFNEAEYGGGISIDSWSTVSIKNTLIADNLANQTGGGIGVFNANVSIDRSTLAYNVAGENSGGIEYKMVNNKVITISNSILWENYPQEIKTFDAQPQIRFSDVMNGYDGYIVMNEDPLFVDIDNNDYHIQWNEYPTESGNKSPAIDSGDPMAELDPDGTIADLGAFYFDQATVTSLNDKNVAYELAIFPNPVQESFNLNSDTNVSKVQISSLSGQVVEIITNVELNAPINISGLKSGIYLLNIYFENSEVVTMKLIKN
jgi:predicted outer membrane repeat protein